MTNKSSTLLLVSSSVRVSLDRLKKDCDHIQVQLIHFRSVCVRAADNRIQVAGVN